ncbi:hypothetical protein [Janibacter melonis]|uniref:hypothetical protein n=1 Tax=Janibacter melonis TaxID=262209 RepID=UPI001748EF18|nr:hypothetical protein [Janibacter melonis]
MTGDDLHTQVRAFADNLTSTLRAVLGDTDEELRATQLEADRFLVETVSPAGFALTRSGGERFLRLRVKLRCGWDSQRVYPRVDRSEIHLVPDTGDTQPLIRYEYDARTSSSIPSAHLQIHTDDPRIGDALRLAGDRTKRSRRRAKGADERHYETSSLHLPLGGTRFRPALEDVLQMAVEEFGVDAADGWQAHLEDGREAWRRTQTRAVVRDAAEEAAGLLRHLGYTVDPPPGGPPDDRLDRLREP